VVTKRFCILSLLVSIVVMNMGANAIFSTVCQKSGQLFSSAVNGVKGHPYMSAGLVSTVGATLLLQKLVKHRRAPIVRVTVPARRSKIAQAFLTGKNAAGFAANKAMAEYVSPATLWTCNKALSAVLSVWRYVTTRRPAPVRVAAPAPAAAPQAMPAQLPVDGKRVEGQASYKPAGQE